MSTHQLILRLIQHQTSCDAGHNNLLGLVGYSSGTDPPQSANMAGSIAAVSRAYTRYALAVQYHGGNLLGFSYQGPRGENCIIYDKRKVVKADLRGIESVEGRIRRALDQLVGSDNYTNIQVSSRTDRGVHAWRNTLQVDIRPRLQRSKGNEDVTNSNQSKKTLSPKKLVHGLNFYLTRLSNYPSDETDLDCKENDMNANNSKNSNTQKESLTKIKGCIQPQYNADQPISNNNLRVLSSAIAPKDITIPNQKYDPTIPEDEFTNPKSFPWDIRFSVTRRTYAYQILHSYDDPDSCSESERDEEQDFYKLNNHYASACYYSQPFEHDRVWKIHEKERRNKTNIVKSLDIDAMNRAGQYLVGCHDFSSFRGNGCQRSSPIVTLEDVWIGQESYHDSGCGGVLSGVWRRSLDGEKKDTLPSLHINKSLRLITIVITGKSFLYHQVRNMVACLVDVGRGKLKPKDVKDILEKRDRSCAPGMAPAHGLFLVDVEHGNFRF